MPISEIGLLRLKPTASLEDPAIQKRLTDIQSHLGTFTGHPFHYFRQVDDPSLLCLLRSVGVARVALPGHARLRRVETGRRGNGKLLCVSVDGHNDFLLDRLATGAGVLEVHRFIMKTDAREEFERQVKATAGDSAGNEGDMVGGWTVDAKEGEEEYTVVLVVDDANKRSSLSEALRLSGAVCRQRRQALDSQIHLAARYLA